ncbi:MAG TPA: phosphotransferase [Anaerolineae bacterium]|nr:phosphotransferase [Anaerolineae bacterium]
MSVYPINPFTQPGRWFKGCLHVHSTASDGRLAPDEVLAWYRQRGYHFVALTDHDVWTQGRTFSDGFITLSGIEIEGMDPQRGLFHLVGLGLRRPPDLHGAGASMQTAINRLREADGRVVIAHPYWSGQRSADLLDLSGCFGLEVFNGGCEVDDAKGFSAVHWDDLLAAGRRLWGVASDDAHWRRGDHDAGLGWVWVRAAALTAPAILEALEQGRFYASGGPEIRDFRLDGGRVYARCSPVTTVDFIGDGHRSRRLTAPPGETMTEAGIPLKKGQRYVRLACRDEAGRWAWSNPIFLDSSA